MSRRKANNSRGFTLIEAVVSILIVGLMIAAAVNTVGAAKFGQWKTAGRARAEPLAFDLLEEILAQRFEEPDHTPAFGPETGESSANGRADFDDVDDYHGLETSPPITPGGSAVEGYEEFTRAVTVQWVRPDAPDQPGETSTNVKRITVTVTQNGAVLARVSALACRAEEMR